MAEVLAATTGDGRARLTSRIRILLTALAHTPPSGEEGALLSTLEKALAGNEPATIWLALATLTGRFPDSATVLASARAARLDGPLAALGATLEPLTDGTLDAAPNVEVVSDRVVVDVHYTSRTQLSTGIQRVARETVKRWERDRDPLLVRWAPDFSGFCRPSQSEALRAVRAPIPPTISLWSASPDAEPTPPDPSGSETVIVPWRCRIVVPELAIERRRMDAYQALARFTNMPVGVIGFDCVPLMAAETCPDDTVEDFCRHLAALAYFDRVVAISETSRREYAGWKAMLGGTGRMGPEILHCPLPVETEEPSVSSLHAARELLNIGALPLVLVVGSHEPRKNHLAVLDAAETLWREGREFSMSFVGGGTWKSASFAAEVGRLQQANRPVQAILGLPDELLWAAYRLAYCTVFVSVHEGFGLPLVESLASGTPAITSAFGSLAEIAKGGGALVTDPYDDQAVTDTLRRMLTEPDLHIRLAGEARRRTWSTWDEYAERVWSLLVDG